MSDKRFSEQIRDAIRNSKMASYQICDAIGISESAMSRFLNNQSGLSLKTLDALAEILGLVVTVDPTRERSIEMLTQTANDPKQLRLRFINNEFHEVVRKPAHIPMKEWEKGEREEIRRLYGADATMSHYTSAILTERKGDSAGLRERRKTIPSWVYERFGIKR